MFSYLLLGWEGGGSEPYICTCDKEQMTFFFSHAQVQLHLYTLSISLIFGQTKYCIINLQNQLGSWGSLTPLPPWACLCLNIVGSISLRDRLFLDIFRPLTKMPSQQYYVWNFYDVTLSGVVLTILHYEPVWHSGGPSSWVH